LTNKVRLHDLQSRCQVPSHVDSVPHQSRELNYPCGPLSSERSSLLPGELYLENLLMEAEPQISMSKRSADYLFISDQSHMLFLPSLSHWSRVVARSSNALGVQNMDAPNQET